VVVVLVARGLLTEFQEQPLPVAVAVAVAEIVQGLGLEVQEARV
jgi:hypothetical protein